MRNSARLRNAVAAVAVAVLGGCLGAGPGACSTDEARAFSEIEHYGGHSLVPQDHSWGVCVASFTEEDPVGDVIGHYREALETEGWEIRDDAAYALAAQRDGLAVTISATRGDAGARRYEILLGHAPPIESG